MPDSRVVDPCERSTQYRSVFNHLMKTVSILDHENFPGEQRRKDEKLSGISPERSFGTCHLTFNLLSIYERGSLLLCHLA